MTLERAVTNHAILISNLLGPPSSSNPRWVWLMLEWGSHLSDGCFLPGDIASPQLVSELGGGGGDNTVTFKVISLNSLLGVDGAELLTASQRSLVAPWGGSWLLRVCVCDL